jgi:hypothetical protein
MCLPMTLKPPGILAPRALPSVIDTVAIEAMEEKAFTLARLTHNFERALAAYLDFVGSADRPTAGWRGERLLAEAGEALWYLVVQREACGLRNTEAVLREYRVPAAVRLRMGAVQRR